MILVALILVVAYCVYVLPNPILKWLLHGKVVYKTDSDILFTFDDSPSPSTNAILDCLHRYGIKAVFFILTDNIEGNEHIMDRIVNEGHIIGNHGTNDRIHFFMSNTAFEIELIESDLKLRPWMHGTQKWFRPGFGFFNESMIAVLKTHHYTVMLGDVFPYDAFVTSPLINAWFIQMKADFGSILVLHDRQWTPPLLHRLLEAKK